MPSLTIENVPEPLLDHLKSAAAVNRRSLEGEVLERLGARFHSGPVDPEAFLERLHALQAEASMPPLTDALLSEALRRGDWSPPHPRAGWAEGVAVAAADNQMLDPETPTD